MATAENREIALMSIQPRFAELIFAGKKRVEFRKTRLDPRVTVVLVYTTTPVRGITGFFEVEGIEEGNPTDLWEQYAAVGGIGLDLFREYFAERALGIAIKVGSVTVFDNPMPLSDLGISDTPPQSFRYLERAAFDRVTRDVVQDARRSVDR